MHAAYHNFYSFFSVAQSSKRLDTPGLILMYAVT